LPESNHNYPGFQHGHRAYGRSRLRIAPAAIHDRTPVLARDDYASWLGEEPDPRGPASAHQNLAFFTPTPDTDSAGDTSSFEFLDRLLFVRLAPGEGPRALDKEEGEPLEAPCPAATPQVSLSLNTTRSHHREAALAQ
jgi:hypothetical protein